jgi:hypothetical protein
VGREARRWKCEHAAVEDRAEVFSRLMEDHALYLIVAALLERSERQEG